MKQHEAKVLIEGFQQLVSKLVDVREVVAHGLDSRLVKPGNGKAQDVPAGHASAVADFTATPPARDGDDATFERLYQRVKARFIDEARIDPILLRLLTQQNELIVEVEPRTVTLAGDTLKGRVARLMADGWFTDPRATGAVRRELARTGPDPGGSGNLSNVLQEFKREGFLTDVSGSYVRAPGVKVTTTEVSVV